MDKQLNNQKSPVASPAGGNTQAPLQEKVTILNKNSSPIILLVEDDHILSRMYTEKFKHDGIRVLNAYDGETGLRLALEQKVDLILLDIMLPKLSGTDLLERLRQDPRGKDIPVVALTNLAEKKEEEKALQYGVKEYLIKAMQTPEQVIEKIKKHLG
jgi:CheY-like chemotaxis protein